MQQYTHEETNVFGSRKIFLLLVIYRIVGINNTLILPPTALANGALGTLVCYVLSFFFLGIPLIYMEMIVSQFTGRDIIDIWKIRPCLSHFGYFVIAWQLFILVYNHSVNSVVVHYLLISFENPQPYYVCGDWATHDCNILKTNFTMNVYCMKVKDRVAICDNLYHTYPEFQYYTRNIFKGSRGKHFFLSWTVCLSSGVIVVVMIIHSVKRMSSVKWFVYPFTMYPLVGYVILLMGSMQQKGLIAYFADALDTSFGYFAGRLRLSNVLQHALYSLGAGSGIYSNLASLAPFRAPCYANTVTSVIYAAAFTTLAIMVTVMMPCPYSFEYTIEPVYIVDLPISFAFVKVPKMLFEYNTPFFWLVIFYSCQSLLGITNNVIIYLTLLEIAAKKNAKIQKYAALVTICTMALIFLVTVPLVGYFGREIMGTQFRKSIFLVSTYFALCESVVFILWYGFGRFYDDIHFMQGLQPRTGIKICWMLFTIVLAYIFCVELATLSNIKKSLPEKFSFYTTVVIVGSTLLVTAIKLAWAAAQGRFVAELKVDGKWGPRDEVLRRSRAMFTAHAMTKEYMYRQYHLQAGIVARQQRSNTRTCVRHNPLFI